MHLTEVEAVFRALKSEWVIPPIWHLGRKFSVAGCGPLHAGRKPECRRRRNRRQFCRLGATATPMNIVHSSAGSLVGNRIQNQRVLVIGSGRGIGIAISARFAAENARVQLVARSESELDEARYLLECTAGVRATTLDLTSPAAIHQVIAEAE